jgi:hypothetical protein
MDNNIEHIWYCLKKCEEEGWFYFGHRAMPWCRCCKPLLVCRRVSEWFISCAEVREPMEREMRKV